MGVGVADMGCVGGVVGVANYVVMVALRSVVSVIPHMVVVVRLSMGVVDAPKVGVVLCAVLVMVIISDCVVVVALYMVVMAIPSMTMRCAVSGVHWAGVGVASSNCCISCLTCVDS